MGKDTHMFAVVGMKLSVRETRREAPKAARSDAEREIKFKGRSAEPRICGLKSANTTSTPTLNLTHTSIHPVANMVRLICTSD